jgi:hypothetical protein
MDEHCPLLSGAQPLSRNYFAFIETVTPQIISSLFALFFEIFSLSLLAIKE